VKVAGAIVEVVGTIVMKIVGAIAKVVTFHCEGCGHHC